MEFRVLGPIEALEHGRPVDLGGAKQRALLAILLLNANRVVSSDRLIEELWPDDPPQTGRAALRVRVSQLRKALGGGDVLVTRAPGYMLGIEPGQLDLDSFEGLADEARRALEAGDADRAADLSRQALGLWRGAPLADVADESFARDEILRLDELRLTALERRIEADLAVGSHGDLVAELEALVARNPLRERLRAQLMLALYRSGRQADALNAYQRARAALVDELGIEPGDALRDLERSILQHDSALDLEPRVRAAAESTRSILVLSRDLARLPTLLSVAEPLALHPRRELVLAHVVHDPNELTAAHRVLQAQRNELVARQVPSRAAAFTSSESGADAARVAREQDVDLALLDASSDELPDLPDDIDAMLDSAPCDVGVLFAADHVGAGRVVVPFAGAEHDWAAVEIAAWFARAANTSLVLVGAAADRRRQRRDASRLLASASLIIQQVANVAAEPLLAAGGPQGVVEAAGGATLIVLGLSERWRREGLGETRTRIVTAGVAPVLLVRRGVRPGGLSPPEGLTRYTWTLASAR